MHEYASPEHIQNIRSNLEQVDRLLDIHTAVTGPNRGRRRNVAVLNRSAIVLITACWEAYVEDLATLAFNFLLENAQDAKAFPKRVRNIVSSSLADQKDPTIMWKLADHGWRDVLVEHKDDVLQKHVGTFNTPRPETVNDLFEKLIGLKNISSEWKWRGCSNAKVLKRFDDLITLRGDIAHRVMTEGSVRKRTAHSYRQLVGLAATTASNQVRNYLIQTTGSDPYTPTVFADPNELES